MHAFPMLSGSGEKQRIEYIKMIPMNAIDHEGHLLTRLTTAIVVVNGWYRCATTLLFQSNDSATYDDKAVHFFLYDD
jgi:hypothetical protein